MAKETDKELVRRVKKGDKQAFDLLFGRYQHKILNLVSRYLRDPEDVQDVTQEAFIKAFRALPQISWRERFLHMALPYSDQYREEPYCGPQPPTARHRRRRR